DESRPGSSTRRLSAQRRKRKKRNRPPAGFEGWDEEDKQYYNGRLIKDEIYTMEIEAYKRSMKAKPMKIVRRFDELCAILALVMVFEFVAAELLNRLLADFVDNVDSSQLNLGLWGGNVTLQNLLIKNSVLDDFELSIKLKFGFISRLELHVPWKNLYTEPFIATVEGLYVIVVPSKGVMYNEERALRIKQHMKQKALLRLDEQLKKLRKPQSAMADSFTEKLLAQVIKNLQVNIRNVHVRYEDNFTNPVRPFEVGATLETLEMKVIQLNNSSYIM
ncbi:unnamed protein product, partial [Toxocara canis]|uniref:Chorein_N domain-containing protein n=1 Tax=Toxocara canis TaxID=6265 RepID=A0A183VAL4_TOXCA